MNAPSNCPHCGDKSGYVTRILLKAERIYSWDGKNVDTEAYELKSETSPRCQDCGASVRAAIATKEQP